MNPLKGTAVELLDQNAPTGAYRVSENGETFDCICPCGCGRYRSLPICIGTKQDRARLWNGNRELPTLSPSIRDVGTCYFHGFMTDGVWTFTGDSGVGP